jgi:hypothetical protein
VPFVSVTRLRIRSVRFMPAFVFHIWRTMRQLRGAPGFLTGQVAGGAHRTFWTLTVWAEEGAMRAYRNGGAHMRAMPRLLDWCDEAAVMHWEQRGVELPALAEAAQRLGRAGRLSKVRHPSLAHERREAWPDRLVPLGGLVLQPRGGRRPT